MRPDAQFLMMIQRLLLLAGFVLDEKSVSRKHLTIAVSPVKSGDGVGRVYLSAVVLLIREHSLTSRVGQSSAYRMKTPDSEQRSMESRSKAAGWLSRATSTSFTWAATNNHSGTALLQALVASF